MTRVRVMRPMEIECVHTSRARSTGTEIGLVDNRLMQFEDMGGLDVAETRRLHRDARWATVCFAHATYCLHGTRATAVSFMAAPEEWCEACYEITEERGAA